MDLKIYKMKAQVAKALAHAGAKVAVAARSVEP